MAPRPHFSIVLYVAGILFRRYDLIPHQATVRMTSPLTVKDNNVQSCYGTDTIPTYYRPDEDMVCSTRPTKLGQT
jgi:hypothetical protein